MAPAERRYLNSHVLRCMASEESESMLTNLLCSDGCVAAGERGRRECEEYLRTGERSNIIWLFFTVWGVYGSCLGSFYR